MNKIRNFEIENFQKKLLMFEFTILYIIISLTMIKKNYAALLECLSLFFSVSNAKSISLILSLLITGMFYMLSVHTVLKLTNFLKNKNEKKIFKYICELCIKIILFLSLFFYFPILQDILDNARLINIFFFLYFLLFFVVMIDFSIFLIKVSQVGNNLYTVEKFFHSLLFALLLCFFLLEIYISFNILDSNNKVLKTYFEHLFSFFETIVPGSEYTGKFIHPAVLVFLLTSFLIQDFIKNLLSGIIINKIFYIKKRNSFIKIENELFFIEDISFFNIYLKNKEDKMVLLSNYNFLANINEKYEIIQVIFDCDEENICVEKNSNNNYDKIENRKKINFTLELKFKEINKQYSTLFLHKKLLKEKLEEIFYIHIHNNASRIRIININNGVPIKCEIEKDKDSLIIKIKFNFEIKKEKSKFLTFDFFEVQNEPILKTLFEIIKEYNKYIKNIDSYISKAKEKI